MRKLFSLPQLRGEKGAGGKSGVCVSAAGTSPGKGNLFSL